MTRKMIVSAVGIAALLGAAPALSQGKSGGTPAGSRAGGASAAAGGGMGAGVGAGPSSPNGVGAGSLASGLDRATEATSGNDNATAGFTNAMDLRAAAQVRRTNARTNSQGAANASDTAKAKANENSVLNDPDE